MALLLRLFTALFFILMSSIAIRSSFVKAESSPDEGKLPKENMVEKAIIDMREKRRANKKDKTKEVKGNGVELNDDAEYDDDYDDYDDDEDGGRNDFYSFDFYESDFRSLL